MDRSSRDNPPVTCSGSEPMSPSGPARSHTTPSRLGVPVEITPSIAQRVFDMSSGLALSYCGTKGDSELRQGQLSISEPSSRSLNSSDYEGAPPSPLR